MTSPSPTHVVLLTPEGRGAVASLLVAGPAATPLVAQWFHPAGRQTLEQLPPFSIVFGRWRSSQNGEEVVVVERDNEHVEIHCHGGAAASRAIVAALVEQGCRAIQWRAWVRDSHDDPIVAAAEIALAAAPTARTAAILLDQRDGALRRSLDQIAARVAAGEVESARASVDELLAWAPLGTHLTEPWRVVLAGRPNTGKSSLVNALVGYRRAIVHGTPGTTRDVLTASTALDGWPIELADTAGLHASDEAIEAAGIELARRRLSQADAVVLVFDASRPRTQADQALAAEWPGAVVVLNKCDLLAARDRLGEDRGLYTSALSGEGVEALAKAIIDRLVPCVPPPGQAMPFRDEHVRTLEALAAALVAGHLDTAASVLSGREQWALRDC